ncbi:MAG: SDR family NAD(P)-dependent oxidoreductase [Novosphingobium sp.]|nr:SDR family NAD(P)-dependent oxidoreductase [Novosphingobium sp.]
MRLSGKTVLVTGGTDGIGAQVIRQLRAKGATVIASGRNRERIAATRADGFEVIEADLSTPARSFPAWRAGVRRSTSAWSRYCNWSIRSRPPWRARS